jgi:DNA-binding SARP family transcriptional activator
MAQNTSVLLARLLPPRRPPACLEREDLVGRVAASFGGRVAAVLAGAGWGKSVLLAQALERAPMPWVWCSCDERLDPSLLLAHLSAGLAERIPGFGAALDLTGPEAAQVAAFANEITGTVADDLLLALDDVHALPPASARTLGDLVRDLPPQIHFAIAARRPLPFPVGRLRTRGVAEFGERDLALSSEVAAGLVRTSAPELDPDRVDEIVSRTEGWMAGLILATQAARAGTSPARSVEEEHLFDFLAEEVFDSQPLDLQRFMLDTAVLDRFTPELAAAVSGRQDATDIIRVLVEGHLFTIGMDAQHRWYRYHHLFQAFLRGRLAKLGGEEAQALHRRAARAWLEAEEPVEAIGHLLAAGDHEEAAEALDPLAEGMATSPQAATLAGYLAALPQELRHSRGSLVLVEGLLSYAQGRFEDAFEGLERAVERLLELDEHDRAAHLVSRFIMAQTAWGGSHERGIALGARYVPRIDPAARMLPRLRVFLAGSYAWVSRFDEAERELQAAMAAPGASDLPGLGAYVRVSRAYHIDAWQGRLREALRGLDDGIAELRSCREPDCFLYLVYAHVHRSYLYTSIGHHEAAIVAIEAACEVAERIGRAGALERLRHWFRALALTGLERWDELEVELVALRREEPALRGTPLGHVLFAHSGRLAAHRGDLAGVRAEVQAARDSLAGLEPEPHQVGVLCELALACHAVGLPDAVEFSTKALTAAETLGVSWAIVRAAIVCAHCEGESPAGGRALQLALALTASGGHDELWSRRLAGALLTHAIVREIGPPGVAAGLAARCGGEVFREVARATKGAPGAGRAALAEAAATAPGVAQEDLELLARDRDPLVRAAARRARSQRSTRSRPALRLIGLGGFAVERDGVPVAHSAFGRERARALLACLLCAGQPVHRERLLEWFWPDLAMDRAVRAFHVSLHALRRGLEPHLTRGAQGSIIESHGESYQVVLHPEDSWDMADFLALSRPAPGGEAPDKAQGLERLIAAEAAYTGQLYPEWLYEEWVRERRAEVEGAYEGVLDRLARSLLAAGRHHEAAARYRRLVDHEPEREAWHRGLMSAYAAAGERALALRQYHACRTLLRRELGVEASEDTRALYATILSAPRV